MIKKLNKMHPSSVGFLEAFGVALYCLLISQFFGILEVAANPPKLWGVAIILFLFVISAAVTGSMVLGYPVYLTLRSDIKRALAVLGYALVFSILILAVALFAFAI